MGIGKMCFCFFLRRLLYDIFILYCKVGVVYGVGSKELGVKGGVFFDFFCGKLLRILRKICIFASCYIEVKNNNYKSYIL